jgi:hypothetical protein
MTKTTTISSCSCCNILMKQGCSNNIQKNGNKIWYVLHNLVENMSSGKLLDKECDTMRLTIRTIISSIPCVECKLHSITLTLTASRIICHFRIKSNILLI